MERIQEQILVSAPQVVGSLPPFQMFDAPVYNQIHQEQIVAGEMTQHRVGNPAVQEHVIVQEIPQVSIVGRIQEQIVSSAPQAVGSFPPLEECDAHVCNQVLQEQIVATVQPRDRFQGIPEVQVLEWIQVSPTTLKHELTSTHQELIVAGQTTQNTFVNSAVQEQVIVHEIPQSPLVVVHFLPQKNLLHPCATKSFWNKKL